MVFSLRPLLLSLNNSDSDRWHRTIWKMFATLEVKETNWLHHHCHVCKRKLYNKQQLTTWYDPMIQIIRIRMVLILVQFDSTDDIQSLWRTSQSINRYIHRNWVSKKKENEEQYIYGCFDVLTKWKSHTFGMRIVPFGNSYKM